MKYCHSANLRHFHNFGLVFFPVSCIVGNVLLLSKAVNYIPENGPIPAPVWLAVILACVFTLLIGYIFVMQIRTVLWANEKYAVTPEGLARQTINSPVRQHDWSEFSEIAVCKVHHETRDGPNTVIRCVIGPEFWGPSKVVGPWAKSAYSIKNRHRIVIIDYSDEVLEEFRAVCPLEIKDYRENTSWNPHFKIRLPWPGVDYE